MFPLVSKGCCPAPTCLGLSLTELSRAYFWADFLRLTCQRSRCWQLMDLDATLSNYHPEGCGSERSQSQTQVNTLDENISCSLSAPPLQLALQLTVIWKITHIFFRIITLEGKPLKYSFLFQYGLKEREARKRLMWHSGLFTGSISAMKQISSNFCYYVWSALGANDSQILLSSWHSLLSSLEIPSAWDVGIFIPEKTQGTGPWHKYA